MIEIGIRFMVALILGVLIFNNFDKNWDTGYFLGAFCTFCLMVRVD
jgi:hypothetical protein